MINRTAINWLMLGLFISIVVSTFLPPVMLAIVGILMLAAYRDKWTVNEWPEKIYIGFIVLSCISWVYNPSWFYWVPIGIIPIVMFGLYFLLSQWVRHVVKWSWPEVQRAYLIFWLAGLYVALIVIIQQIDWHVINNLLGPLMDFYSDHRWESEHSVRSVGTSGNSNLAAALLICFALMSIYAMSILKKPWQKIGAFAVFVLYCAAIWCTGSRGAWVGLVIGMIVQLWMTGHRKRTVTITLAILLFVYLFPQFIPRKESLYATIEVRLKVWLTALDIFKENWLFGVLPLHFGQLFAKIAGFYVWHAHNIFLGVASEYGIIGLGLFLALVFMTIRRARRWRKQANQKEEKRLAGMLLSLTIALLGHGMYDYPIIAPQVGLMFMLSVIMIHTQYERRCLCKPIWDERSKAQASEWTIMKRMLSAAVVWLKGGPLRVLVDLVGGNYRKRA
ncbi:O-antigen ligase family protein [Laceyella putida]|uniref:O-antigen ligase family protein n=1 Tax=Laceyella putida TaxID=110101 RepID=A0ABW2RI67_9BACL